MIQQKRRPRNMAFEPFMWALAALTPLTLGNSVLAQQKSSEKPAEVRITRHMEFVRPAPTFEIALDVGENSGLVFNIDDPKTWSGAGFEAKTTEGFPSRAAQTSEEIYFRISSFPSGYTPAQIQLGNHVDPTDVNDVEHTPRYFLYLYPNRLMGHVWLRRRGINATATSLDLNMTVVLIRDDLYDASVKAGKAFPTSPGTLVYFRNIDTCGRDHHLHIDYTAITHVNESITRVKDPDNSANRLFVPC